MTFGGVPHTSMQLIAGECREHKCNPRRPCVTCRQFTHCVCMGAWRVCGTCVQPCVQERVQCVVVCIHLLTYNCCGPSVLALHSKRQLPSYCCSMTSCLVDQTQSPLAASARGTRCARFVAQLHAQPAAQPLYIESNALACCVMRQQQLQMPADSPLGAVQRYVA